VIFGWSLLVIAVAITANLSYTFVRIMVMECSRLPKRERAPLPARLRKLGRIMSEPILGR
jgi:hypothetical protein